MPRRTLETLLLSAGLVAACATPPAARAPSPMRADDSAPVADTLPHAAPDLDLSGGWITGSGVEPAVKQIVLRPECNVGPALWILEQSGDTVRALRIPESHAQGIATPPHARAIEAVGRLSGAELTMRAAGVRYALHFDPTSGHLRGTRNDAPIWAVRVEVQQPQNCIPVP